MKIDMTSQTNNQPKLSPLCPAQSFKFSWVLRTGFFLLLGSLVFAGCGGEAGSASAPTVSSTSPLSDLSNVATTTAITAKFSEAIGTSTITTETFTLNNGATGTVAYNATRKVATFTPSANLLSSTAYTATITGGETGVKDVAGNPLASNYVWSFTTADGESASSDEATATPLGFEAQAYLKAPNAEAYDYFGVSVAVSGDTVAVGAYGEDSNQTTITNGETASADNSTTYAGAVYIFRRTGVTWAQEAYLKAPNAWGFDWFGYSVAVSGDTVAVGAYGENSNQTTITNGETASADNSASFSGAVYIFRRTNSIWAQEAYLKAPNAEAYDNFGNSVAVSGDTVAVGAYYEASNQTTITNGATASTDNSTPGAGAVYIFRRTSVTWTQDAYLKAPNADEYDNFGYSVAVSGDTVAVGAYREGSNQTTITNGATASADNSASSAGAVYIFVRP